jgi:hypothetical protein
MGRPTPDALASLPPNEPDLRPAPAGQAGPTSRIRLRFRAVRRVNAGTYHGLLLVSAVATILGLRAYLEATGYPQVGGSGLHIAHMLWGGLFMLVALVLLLSFVGLQARLIAALAGGIGFGLFIDELGKFITSDNDYFFEPTVGLLYIIFVVMFMVFNALEVRRPLRPDEGLANATDALADLVISGATPTARARALAPLDASGTAGPLATAVRAFVDAAPKVEEAAPSLPTRLSVRVRATYRRLISSRWFGRAILAIFLFNAVGGLLGVLAIAVVLVGTAMAGQEATFLTEVSLQAHASGWTTFGLYAVASLVVLSFTVFGAIRFRFDRLAGLRWFERSVLVSLLLVDPLNFFAQQFAALGNLGFDLVLWVGSSYLVAQEVARRRA